MITNTELQGLTLDDLSSLGKRIDDIYKEKSSETRKLLWVVEDNSMELKYFREDEYIVAVEYLLQCAIESNKNNFINKQNARNFVLAIRPKFIIESDYESYFE